MEIRDNWLFSDNVMVEETPNMGGVIIPEYLVIHFTAGRNAEKFSRTLQEFFFQGSLATGQEVKPCT